MNEKELRKYIQSQLERQGDILRTQSQDMQGNSYLKRNYYIRLKMFIDRFRQGQSDIRIVCITGLRGIGKTTVLAQMFLELVSEEEVFFIKADELVTTLRSNIHDVLREYQKFRGIKFESLKKNLFIFIDEIQFDENWVSTLKSIYDTSKKVFIICTGSSALALRSTADLARRVVFEDLYPMNFSEYILLKTELLSKKEEKIQPKFPVAGLKKAIKQNLFKSSNAEECFCNLQKIKNNVDLYWSDIDSQEIDWFLKFGSLPNALTIVNEEILIRITSEVIDKVLTKDFSELGRFTIEKIDITRALLLTFAVSSETSLSGLSSRLSIAVNTLIDICGVLEKAELVIRVYPYSPSAIKAVRKPSKFYFMSPALRYALLSMIDGKLAFEKYKGKYIEDVISLYLHREFERELLSRVFYDSAEGGADFLLQLEGRKIAIEAGYGKKGIAQAKKTIKDKKCNYGLVISDSDLAIFDNVVKVPLKFFLLV